MIKLYEENSYTKEFEAKIINIDKEIKMIELENTAFMEKVVGNQGIQESYFQN